MTLNDITPGDVAGLYYKYKRRTTEEIQKYLDSSVKLVTLGTRNRDQTFGYREITGKVIKAIKENPRGKSLTFDLWKEGEVKISKEVLNLKVHSKLLFLVKSSSRFFYKPDIGEICDQMDFYEMRTVNTKIVAININCSNYVSLPNTEGEHFVCTVDLLESLNTN